MSIRIVMTLWPVLAVSILSWAQCRAADTSGTSYSLHAIVDLALQRNPTISGAKASIEQSRGQQMTAAAYPNPSITGAAGRGAIRDPSTGVTIIEHTITVEQPLEWPAKRDARQRAAEAAVAGANAALEEAQLDLITQVKMAFYRLLMAQREAELSTHNLAMVKDVLRTVTTRIEAGDATRFDVMKATVEVQKAAKDAARAHNAVVTARVALNTRTAGALGNMFAVQGDFEPLRQGIDLERLTARALEEHPSLRRLGRLVDQASHAVTFEQASRIPNISVQGQYHREAGDESVIGGLSIPIPIWYRRQGEIHTALAGKQRLEADRERLQNDLIQALAQHTQEARTAKDQIEVFERGLLKQAEETLRIAQFSFKHGGASLLELFDAQHIYRQTLFEYAQARADWSIALAQLQRASGGAL